MKKKNKINKILIISAGPILNDQAYEFFYSSNKVCKTFKEKGYEIVLAIWPPTSNMTDSAMVDKTYIEPLSTKILTDIILIDRPDAILQLKGAITGLNLVMDLYKTGVLEKYHVELIGVPMPNRFKMPKIEVSQYALRYPA